MSAYRETWCPPTGSPCPPTGSFYCPRSDELERDTQSGIVKEAPA